MSVVDSETIPVASEPDMVTVRRRVREVAARDRALAGRSDEDRNGRERIGSKYSDLRRWRDDAIGSLNGPRLGVRLTFTDQGPGIPDISLALRDGFTTGSGLGLGLSGSKRLVNEFEIESKVGQGTRVAVTRWK